MGVQGGRGYLQMWSILLVLTTLTGYSVAEEGMCYKLSPYRARIDKAQSKCVAAGGHLMRIRGWEEQWEAGNITSHLPSNEYYFIDGYYSDSSWRYHDGTPITWHQNWHDGSFDFRHRRRIYVNVGAQKWIDHNINQHRQYICETPKVETVSTNGSCYQPAPVMENANKMENSTHVVYECNDGYELPNGDTSKTLDCGCAALTNMEPCVEIRQTCLVNTYGTVYRPYESWVHCLHVNASLPKVLTQRQNDALQQNLAEEGISSCFLDVVSGGYYLYIMLDDGSDVNYTNFGGQPTWHPSYRFVTIAANNGLWSSKPYNHYGTPPVCEIVKEQVEGGCSTGRPTYPHSTKTSQNETHVTYSCDTNYAFPDGTLQKTIKCGCENAMLVHACHLADRNICLQPVHILLNRNQAELYCKTSGGTLAKIINAAEMTELQPALYKRSFWIAGHRKDDGVWYWDDGTDLVSALWYHGHPKGNQAGNSYLATLHPSAKLVQHNNEPHKSLYFVCEMEPAGTCAETIPVVPHSSATTNGTHFTYICDDRYTFDDGSPNKTVRCNCAELTKLAGCHKTSRDVCFINTPLRENATAARTYCASFGTSLAKTLSEEERDRLSDVMSPYVPNGWVGAKLNTTDDKWEWDEWSNETLVWEDWYYGAPDFTRNGYIYLHLRKDRKYLNDVHGSGSCSVFCEKEYDPSLPCSEDPPGIAHGTVSATNTTHVTYRCDENYAFADGEPERSFLCGCEVLANVSPCLFYVRDVYYFSTAYEVMRSVGVAHCQLPRSYNYDEHKRIQSLVISGRWAHLAGFRNYSTWHWMWEENEEIVWNLFQKGHPTPAHSNEPYLRQDRTYNVWFYTSHGYRRQLICEKIRRRNITCDTEEPPPVQDATFTHNGTHVTYTCNDKYAFKDGDVFKIYPCDVASLAPLYPCHLHVARDLCYVYIKAKATHTAATNYCKKLNATLAKILNDGEQQVVASMWKGNTWIQGSDSGENGVWKLDDGSRLVYDKTRANTWEHASQQFMYMTSSKDWYPTHRHNNMYFICERKADPISNCTSPPPAMRYADMTYDVNHVTYTCHAGAKFYNGATSKTYTCRCASFEVNMYCIRYTRNVCFTPTKVRRYFEAQVIACQQYNLSIAHLINQNELNTVADLRNTIGDSNYYIGASSLPLAEMFIYPDGTPMYWSRWAGGYDPGTNNAVYAYYNKHMYQSGITSLRRAACEVDGTYSCEDAPEVENAEKTVTATEVIYTCKPHHNFSDGEAQKTYSCLCAQSAVMENCVHESRPVCIARAVTENTFQRAARAICRERNAELPRLINDGDVARFQALGVHSFFVDGDNMNPSHIFKYSDDKYIRWIQHAHDGLNLFAGTSQHVLYVNSAWKYQRVNINDLRKVYCEVPEDVTCTQAPPEVPHATFVSNSTHVNYTCDTGYKFLDGTTEKIYPCECVNTATIDPCKGPRPMCFAQSEFQLNQDHAECFCNKQGGHLAKINSVEEIDLIRAKMKTSSFVSGNDKESAYDFRWYDNTVVQEINWGNVKGSEEQRALYLNNGRLYHRKNYESLYFVCEKEPDAELCGTAPLDISIAHGSCEKVDDVVTCTCDSDSQYYDGSTVETYSCDCASLALMKPCALKTRSDLCLLESSVKRTHADAHTYCKQNSGRLAILYTQAEQDRLLAMSGRVTLWIDGMDDVEGKGVWKLSTGDLIVWQGFWPVPSNTSRNRLLVDRTSATWKDGAADEIHGFVCEAPIDPDCSSSAPYIDNANRILGTSTVTYYCLDGYTFLDGTQEQTHNCQCYGLLDILKCIRRAIYTSSYPTTHEDAEETCVYLGGNLLEVNYGTTSASILGMIDYHKVSSAWISSMSTHVNSFGSVDCITIDANGQWTDTNCTHQHHFACQFGDVDELPLDVKSKLACWKLNDLLWGVPDDLVPSPCDRSSVYFTPGSLQTWTGAKDTCASLGGNLARATNNNEAWMLAAVSERNDMQEAWIDGGDKSGEMRSSRGKVIVTPDGVTLTFDATNSLECLLVEGLAWTDGDCDTQQQFICEKKIDDDWPDRTYCLWKEELTQTHTDAQATCQQHGADLAWMDNAWDWASIVDASGTSVVSIWLKTKEEISGVWGGLSWSHWAEGGQDTGQLGCMVYDGQSRRIREHSCTATDVTGFFCRRSVKPNRNRRVLKNLESVLSIGCNPGFAFRDGSTKKVVSSAIDCKTINSWDNPSDPYNACYSTNNFMMKQFGNYKTEDEQALTDKNHETCTDLVKLWSKGPKIVNFQKAWSCTSPFTVTIFMNDELKNLLKDNRKDKIIMRVEVSKDSPWEGDKYGKNRQFTKCRKASDTTYSCLCLDNVNPFSVFVSVTVRDPNVLTQVSSLEICDISITPHI